MNGRQILTVWGLVGCCWWAGAQKADSLKQVADTARGENQIQAWVQLSIAYASLTDSAVFFSAKAYDAVQQQRVSDLMRLRALIQHANSLTENRQLEEAQPVIDPAIVLAERMNDSMALSVIYNIQANRYFYMVQHEQALPFYRTALEIEERLGNPQEYAKSLANFGITLGQMGRFEEQLETYQKALRIFEAEGQKGSSLRILVNLCIAFAYKDRSYTNLDSAIFYGKWALRYAEELQFPFGIAKTNSALASPLIRKGYSEPAYLAEGLKASQSAREFFASSPNFKADYQLAYLNEGYAYEALGETNKAIFIAEELLREGFLDKGECYRLIYRSHKRAGQHDQALWYHEQMADFRDSLNNLNLKVQMNELQTKYETVKKDGEIASLSQQAQIQALMISQRNTQLIGVGVILLLLLAGGYAYVQQRRFRHLRTVSDMEQRMLRLQMNPHFIFNALSSIQHYILQRNTAESVSYLSRFAKLMRQILEHSREEYITIAEETEMLKNYLEIQQLRFQHRFTYEIQIDPSLDAEEVRIPPLFAQPFVENAIEHGLQDKETGGLLTIRFLPEGQNIRLEVEDNGKGLQLGAEITGHKSLATIITRDRLRIFEKRLKTKFLLDIQPLSQGTRASVVLPAA